MLRSWGPECSTSHWLPEQGLGHHAETFAKNGIAGDILRDFTDADLREFGVHLGDRKRLLKSIAALPAAASTQRPAETSARTVRRAVARDAERSQLTVLFCDLVGSTELSGRLDPEEMSEVIRAYHRCCGDLIGRWVGHVAKDMGDGVLAYFGWPRAQEDDAERAVRAGIELGKAVGEQIASDGTGLAARIGIATGQEASASARSPSGTDISSSSDRSRSSSASKQRSPVRRMRLGQQAHCVGASSCLAARLS